ncbi:MAG TPA: glycosyltransferase family A protein [Gammaproteobacteria bacterium]|nr:glycosyltransferase family A protein [Gammaproteobacteria bacterium]
MSPPVPGPGLRDAVELWFLRLAAGGLVPARWFLPSPPAEQDLAARTGRISLEIVSHCWGYAHMLAYQLSSLVLHPPARLDVTMTVFYAVEDEDTVALLEFFGTRTVPGVTWNWRVLDKGRLFRRAIGRNLAARETACDWVWFTDCDVLFHAGCLDGLASALQGRRDALVFPREEHISALLKPSDEMLNAARSAPRVVDIDVGRFTAQQRDRATGPLQITHGDIARACGYCANLRVYQQPSSGWAKAHEDRAFRWLLRTRGQPVDVPGVYRIRHLSKGRYRGGRLANLIRTTIRRIQARLREGANGDRDGSN